MKTRQRLNVISLLVIAGLASPALAADRMRAGQWTGTTVIGPKTYPTSSCISQADADAINGDAKAVQGYLQSIIPPEICKIIDVKAEGPKIVYTATCGNVPAKVVTTTYHGNSSEGSDSTGGTTTAKLVGPCK